MLALVLLHLVCLKQASSDLPALVKEVENSGRCVTLAESPDSRVTQSMPVAPGLPPLLTFRYFEGKQHHRFGNAELMLDDAGH